MAEDGAEALQWFRKHLEWLEKQYPELKTTEHQVRLAAELRRRKEEDRYGDEIDG
jgi:hypothetical protein